MNPWKSSKKVSWGHWWSQWESLLGMVRVTIPNLLPSLTIINLWKQGYFSSPSFKKPLPWWMHCWSMDCRPGQMLEPAFSLVTGSYPLWIPSAFLAPRPLGMNRWLMKKGYRMVHDEHVAPSWHQHIFRNGHHLSTEGPLIEFTSPGVNIERKTKMFSQEWSTKGRFSCFSIFFHDKNKFCSSCDNFTAG